MLKRMADEMLIARIRPLLLSMADQTWRETFSDHGFSNECERGRGDTKRIWWVQAEAVLGGPPRGIGMVLVCERGRHPGGSAYRGALEVPLS